MDRSIQATRISATRAMAQPLSVIQGRPNQRRGRSTPRCRSPNRRGPVPESVDRLPQLRPCSREQQHDAATLFRPSGPSEQMTRHRHPPPATQSIRAIVMDRRYLATARLNGYAYTSYYPQARGSNVLAGHKCRIICDASYKNIDGERLALPCNREGRDSSAQSVERSDRAKAYRRRGQRTHRPFLPPGTTLVGQSQSV